MAQFLLQSVPGAFVLMKSKRNEMYVAGFTMMKTIMRGLNPQFIMSDYEASIHTAVETVFPMAEHRGCWFHYCQVRNAV